MRRTAALIVGGGPAGSAAAITLARGGVRALLIERQRETGDALCGGFLSWHSLTALDRLGLLSAARAGAAVDHVRLITTGRSAEARLPAPALGLSRRALDEALLQLAGRGGAAIERGVAAREADENGQVRIDGDSIAADAVFLATGKHELRGLARPRDAAGADPTLGLRVRLGPSPALARLVGGAIELHLFDRGYAGLLMQEDGTANLCLAVHKSRLNEEGSPAALIEALGRELPRLGERLAWLDSQAPIDAIASVPYGWRARTTSAGIFRLGDQAGVIPSLAGEGMGIALASGIAAAQAYLIGGPTASQLYQRRFADRLSRPIGVAGMIRAAAERPSVAPWLATTMRIAPGLATLLARATRI